MKKCLLMLGLMVWASLIFAQTAEVTIGTVNNPPAPSVVQIPITLNNIENPGFYGNSISGFAFYFSYNASVCNNTVTYTHDAVFSAVGSFVTSVTQNSPIPGWNTVAVVYATGEILAVSPGQLITTAKFNYLGGATNLNWSTASFLCGGLDVKTLSYMVDYDGNTYNPFITHNGFLGAVATGKTWTGAINNDWLNDGNWAPPGVPTTEDVIVNGGKLPDIHIGGTATCGALTVTGAAKIFLDPNGSLTTSGTYTNTGGELIITSDGAGKSGSFINNGILAPASTGFFEFDRNTWWNNHPSPNPGPPPFNMWDWHFISSPISAGFENWDFLDYYALTWNAGLPGWTNMGGGAPGCVPAPLATISGLDAWAINWDPIYTSSGCPGGVGQNIVMRGAFLSMQVGPLSKAAVFGPGGGTPPFVFGPGWNMYGNPYTSSLAVAGLNYTGFAQGVAMFDPQSDNYVYSTLANSWAAGNIAPTQGFMMQTSGPGNSLFLTPANRTNDATVIWKSDATNLLTLEATGNGFSDKLWVNIDFEGALPGIDYVGDFSKMFAPGLPQIYTVAEGQKLAVNALPATPSVPMEFVAGASGTYTIAAIETGEFENVVLEDLVTGIETDLLAGSYSFEYTEANTVHGFVIHFTPLGTPELEANNINIWAADHNIYVQAPATTGDIVVYNLMGQEVVRTDIEAGLNVIPMTDVNTYYIVKVIGSDVTETGKVFIK